MSRKLLFACLVLLAAGVVLAVDVPETETETGTKSGTEPVASATEGPEKTEDGATVISGMSILGNQEAPKSLVIVPWKSSGIGDSLGISTMLDDSKQPVDKEVFMRALSYYEISVETKP